MNLLKNTPGDQLRKTTAKLIWERNYWKYSAKTGSLVPAPNVLLADYFRECMSMYKLV